MCNIAGYTGNKQAAPILIEMLKREQYMDGGVCTGIATIHEGKLYHTKVVGNVDVLLETTDALNFPGTVGIAHSRPSGTDPRHAHPFIDRNENLAIVLNGTLRDVKTDEFLEHSRSVMQGFLDRGFPIRTAYAGSGLKTLSNGMTYHDSEPYALYIGDVVDSGSDLKSDTANGMAAALDEIPADIVVLCIHCLLEGTITAGRITRPMAAGIGDGETYLATSAIAFPEDAVIRNVVNLPVCSVSQITPGAVNITDKMLKNVRVEEITAKMYAKAYERLEAILINQEKNPKSLYDFSFYNEWRDVWSEPYVDCKFAKEGGLLKPYAALSYETLYAFYKEGRLHMTLGERNGKPITKFWVK